MMSNLSPDDIRLYLDLTELTNTGMYSNISIEANIPVNTRLIEIEPSFFDIEIIEREIKDNDTANTN